MTARAARSDEADAQFDRRMMTRCIKLAISSGEQGEYPYAAVICRDRELVCESINPVGRDGDVTHHAEMVGLSLAQQRLGRISLQGWTLYANAESCAMCSYAMRESRIGRVVLGMAAPLTSGLARWNVLADPKLNEVLPEVFAPAPENRAGLHARGMRAGDRALESAGLDPDAFARRVRRLATA